MLVFVCFGSLFMFRFATACFCLLLRALLGAGCILCLNDCVAFLVWFCFGLVGWFVLLGCAFGGTYCLFLRFCFLDCFGWLG